MATIIVAGVSLPEPTQKKRKLARLGQDSRGGDGSMQSQYIANKRTYDVVWATMSPASLYSMQQLLKPANNTGIHFAATILDAAEAGGVYTGTFYAGDIDNETKLIINSVEVVTNVKTSLIEV